MKTIIYLSVNTSRLGVSELTVCGFDITVLHRMPLNFWRSRSLGQSYILPIFVHAMMEIQQSLGNLVKHLSDLTGCQALAPLIMISVQITTRAVFKIQPGQLGTLGLVPEVHIADNILVLQTGEGGVFAMDVLRAAEAVDFHP